MKRFEVRPMSNNLRDALVIGFVTTLVVGIVGVLAYEQAYMVKINRPVRLVCMHKADTVREIRECRHI